MQSVKGKAWNVFSRPWKANKMPHDGNRFNRKFLDNYDCKCFCLQRCFDCKAHMLKHVGNRQRHFHKSRVFEHRNMRCWSQAPFLEPEGHEVDILNKSLDPLSSTTKNLRRGGLCLCQTESKFQQLRTGFLKKNKLLKIQQPVSLKISPRSAVITLTKKVVGYSWTISSQMPKYWAIFSAAGTEAPHSRISLGQQKSRIRWSWRNLLKNHDLFRTHRI